MRLVLCFLLLFVCHTLNAESEQSGSALDCLEFMCEPKKILLFTIKGNSGKKAIDQFKDTTSSAATPRPAVEGSTVIPDVFRSSYLNDLPKVIKLTGFNSIVIEMRKNGKVVANATFDVTQDVDKLDSLNWFNANRLVDSFPYWSGNNVSNYVDVGVLGHRMEKYQRSFYIHHYHGICKTDHGMMGIGEDSTDACDWVTDGGKPPVLFYSKKKGTYKGTSESVVGYADLFLVYLTNYKRSRE